MIDADTLFLILGCIIGLGVIFTGIIVKEIQIHQERKLFNKSDVKYTDGDNT